MNHTKRHPGQVCPGCLFVRLLIVSLNLRRTDSVLRMAVRGETP